MIAQLASMFYNANRKKNARVRKVADFLPKWDEPPTKGASTKAAPQSWQSMKATIKKSTRRKRKPKGRR